MTDFLPVIPNLAITHSGVFHSDEVMAIAFLKLINKNLKVVRVRSSEEIATVDRYDDIDTIIVDIGGGRYDHHTPNSKESRITTSGPELPYASFGKVVRDYYPYLMSESNYKKFDYGIVAGIDGHDCTGKIPGTNCGNPLSAAISAFNPLWCDDNSPEAMNKAFEEAVEFAENILKRFIHRYEVQDQANEIAEKAISKMAENSHVMTLERFCPYGDMTKQNPNIYWAVYPGLRGGFQLFSVTNPDKSNRDLLSEDMKELLRKSSKCRFVHVAGFTAAFDSAGVAKEIGEISSKIKEAESEDDIKALLDIAKLVLDVE